MMMDDYDGQMIFGDFVGLKLPDIRLTGEENPAKISPRKLVPTGDRTRARCVTTAHATTCSTAVDWKLVNDSILVIYISPSVQKVLLMCWKQGELLKLRTVIFVEVFFANVLPWIRLIELTCFVMPLSTAEIITLNSIMLFFHSREH